jgi:tetrahydromethanopterin S-methyltransferase subunit C
MALSNQSNVHEGKMTRAVEEQTAKVPSIGYLGLAFGSMAVSAALAFGFKRKEVANFIGLWAPTILIMGLYNKIVKIEHETEGFSEKSSTVNTSAA